jgi:predicted SprT family Zn-dependent metalloprotease
MQGTVNVLAKGLWPSLTGCPPLVRHSDKLTRTAGKFTPNHIVIARKYFTAHGGIETMVIILHELCHWAIWSMGVTEGDQHGPIWRAEAKRVGLEPEDVNCLSGW